MQAKAGNKWKIEQKCLIVFTHFAYKLYGFLKLLKLSGCHENFLVCNLIKYDLYFRLHVPCEKSPFQA